MLEKCLVSIIFIGAVQAKVRLVSLNDVACAIYIYILLMNCCLHHCQEFWLWTSYYLLCFLICLSWGA